MFSRSKRSVPAASRDGGGRHGVCRSTAAASFTVGFAETVARTDRRSPPGRPASRRRCGTRVTARKGPKMQSRPACGLGASRACLACVACGRAEQSVVVPCRCRCATSRYLSCRRPRGSVIYRRCTLEWVMTTTATVPRRVRRPRTILLLLLLSLLLSASRRYVVRASFRPARDTRYAHRCRRGCNSRARLCG